MAVAETLKALFHKRLNSLQYPPFLKPKGHFLAHRLDNSDLPVIYTTAGSQAPLGAANFVGRRIGRRPALFLIFFTWASHMPEVVERSVKAMAAYHHRRPDHRFIFLCNTELERAAHSAAGLNAVLCNDNAFVDESVFKPIQAPVRYDAVYNAAIAAWKRRELCQQIDTCLQIAYKRGDVSRKETAALIEEARRTMPSHTFANPITNGDIAHIPYTRVAELLPEARCGLCLSAVEGAMWASIEYMLCGLPVVSTPSLGGREEFADPEYWVTVEPTADAVAAGVRQMVARNLSPEHIRTRTLERMHVHRSVLRDLVARETDGLVQLPDDLRDAAYRFISKIATRWARTADLPKILRL